MRRTPFVKYFFVWLHVAFLQRFAHAAAIQTFAERRRPKTCKLPKINILKGNFVARKDAFKVRLMFRIVKLFC
jgi:hypothetical protein